MSYIDELGKKAKAASGECATLTEIKKNEILKEISDLLLASKEEIIAENKKDIENAHKNNMTQALIDRLTLTEARIDGMAEGVMQVMALADPVGKVLGGGTLKNGLSIVKKSVPLGVIGIIFESRPNVTVDAGVLCLKAGNTVILRGGSDAINSNKCLVGIMRKAAEKHGVNPDIVQLVEDTSRETATELMKANDYLDVLIPRGGGGLINAVIKNATVPVIQTGEGNCHVYVDRFADIDAAVEIVDNAKTQRPSVCNAIENVLVHKNIAEGFLKKLSAKWNGKVQFVGDSYSAEYITLEREATDEDYRREFLDYTIAVKIVDDIDEAIAHINRFGTKHSECIVTEHLKNAEKFQREIDAAAVYVNASTRFTDGFEFGLGAEIGISTQKLHVRGPMGLEALTTFKYLINGNGQIRG
ncbi:MAG: glutamate-5-semialdehyde dehydrogenase [Ruminiclostridium sp.]|nr:glutamate-5-semialdehyde dehydrogenase [Ruminiclostridium sp.]